MVILLREPVKSEAKDLLARIGAWEYWPTIAQVAEREYGVSPAEFDRLLPEYQKFLVLCKLYPVSVGMHSSSIDKLWHAHLLHSRLYADFCERHIGWFVHHVPNLVDAGSDCSKICAGKPCDTAPPTPRPPSDCVPGFMSMYQEAFAVAPSPTVWNLPHADGSTV